MMVDTSCTSINWIPIYFTEDTVNVLPFAPEHYKSIKEVLVAPCGTIIPTQTRKEWLVVGHGMLYFGDKMEEVSLINSNQIRIHGL